MSEAVEPLDLDDLLDLALRLLGPAPPLRDVGLLGAAAARPLVALQGEDVYSDVWAKAAALLQSLLRDRPLLEGNNGLAWLATATFLELNGEAVADAANDDVYHLVMTAAAGDDDLEALSAALRAL